MENAKEENDKIYILDSRKNIDSFINKSSADFYKKDEENTVKRQLKKD